MHKKCEQILKELESEGKIKVWWGYTFPEEIELTKKLKDMLEDEVDEKYYLSDEKITKIQNSNFMQEKKRIQDKDYSDTILARDWKDPKCVRIGGIFDTENSKHQAGSIYDKEGLSPTLDVAQGGWRQSSILEDGFVEKKYNEFIKEKGYVPEMFNPYNKSEIKDIAPTQSTQCGSMTSSATVMVLGNYMPSNHDASRIVSNKGLAPTVKENHGTVTAVVTKNKRLNSLINKTNFEEGKVLNMDLYNQTTNENISQCLTEPHHNTQRLFDGYRIRKLTPKECWRLMGFSDEDFEKAANVPTSNTQLYKQARKLNLRSSIRKNIFKFIKGVKIIWKKK